MQRRTAPATASGGQCLDHCPADKNRPTDGQIVFESRTRSAGLFFLTAGLRTRHVESSTRRVEFRTRCIELRTPDFRVPDPADRVPGSKHRVQGSARRTPGPESRALDSTFRVPDSVGCKRNGRPLQGDGRWLELQWEPVTAPSAPGHGRRRARLNPPRPSSRLPPPRPSPRPHRPARVRRGDRGPSAWTAPCAGHPGPAAGRTP